MTIPNWQNKFRDLPEIPEHKTWLPGKNVTREHEIARKFVDGPFLKRLLTVEETNIFLELIYFYESLYESLSRIDYNTFTSKDVIDFENYIFYAFNYEAIIQNPITFYSTYRLVVNEKVVGSNVRIVNIKHLKNPQLDLVKRLGRFNRANTLKTSVFYCTQDIDTSLKEIRPPTNRLITVGVWKPIREQEFISYPIFHNDEIITKNPEANRAMSRFDKILDSSSPPLFKVFMANYFKLIGREFSKKVSGQHYEYIISALFAEKILETRTLRDHPNNDCIIYPSVGNNHQSSNFAIKHSIIENDFYLSKAMEFEVEESYYDNSYSSEKDPESISLAKIKNLKVSKSITGNQIIW